MTASLLSRRPAGIYKMNRMNISSRRFHEKIIRNMKKIALLLPCGEVMGSAVVGPYAIFAEVNAFLAQRGQPPAFKVELVGCKRVPSFSEGAFRVQPHCLLEHASGYDMAIVPGFTSEAESMLAANQPLIGWLKQQYEMHGTELASLCSGAFFIAATGLANGKKCTTHWAYAAEFRARFPKVNLLADRIVTDDGGIYASGGAYSSLNLVLYLLEKFCGKTAAVWAAKVFQIDLHRTSQKPFVIFNNQKSHTDADISRAQEYIEQHYNESLSVTGLASRFAFSRRNFLRRFKEATGNTPIEYLQRVRIEAAKRLLENSAGNIGEVVAASGYSDVKTFRQLFKKYTGFSPTGYRNRYRV